MGNRAVLSFGNVPKNTTGIYLHWNGGRASIEAFLQYARDAKLRENDSYGIARLVQAIGNWFGGGLSLGVDNVSNLDCDNGDNGVYVIGPGWQIVDRKYFQGSEEFGPEKTANILAEMHRINDPIFMDGGECGGNRIPGSKINVVRTA